ncbi:universal stress protein [Prosthecobacter sp. SYSU 5D2]|uniref:universal stress protein n=1 Tax=Prosthecobacter sp. SYSU 5D2 TaxID=3134134 RepID=UPI0031FE6B57
MSTILACTDGSQYAPSVYQHSAWAASRMGAGIRVLHVLDPHREHAMGADFTGAIGFDASAELTAELVKLEENQARVARLKGKAILEDAEKQLQAAGISQVETVQRHGSLAETLEELEPAAELVVIGKRGEHANFAKGHLGGQVERVIRTSVRPVLVAARAFKPIQRFLIAYDGGPSVLKAVDFVMNSPLLKGCHCHLLRAGKVDDNARYFLEEAAEKLRSVGFTVVAAAEAGSPEEIIANVVKTSEIDLLVMGAYGHSPIRQFILGSTTTTMVRTCQIPVLMFR